MNVKVRLLKWQGSVVPERSTEPPRIACLDVPPVDIAKMFNITTASGMVDPIYPEFADRRWALYAEESDADRMAVQP